MSIILYKPGRRVLRLRYKSPPGSGSSQLGEGFVVSEDLLHSLHIPPRKDMFYLSRRTAVSFVFVTAASPSFFLDSLQTVASIQRYGPSRPVLYYDLGLRPQQAKQVTLYNAGQVTLYNAGQVTLYNAGQVTLYNAGQVTLYNAQQVTLYNVKQVTLYNAKQVTLYNAKQVTLYNAEQVTLYNALLTCQTMLFRYLWYWIFLSLMILQWWEYL